MKHKINSEQSASGRGVDGFLPRDRNNRGRGPRGYQRSDARILEDINDRLCDNAYLDASEMEVGISDGAVVVLNGTVNSREEKRLAADIAESVSGVENVENRLRVRVPGV